MSYIKTIRDGHVAVIISPGYGAGWSTWNADYAEQLAFDSRIVQAVENQLPDIDPLMAKIFGPDAKIYTGGWKQAEIIWLPSGTQFIIQEYDGSESIQLLTTMGILTA